MASLNKVMLIGRLGRDPELRYTNQSNTAVCSFTIATDESYNDRQSNERKEKTEWHKIVVWGRQGETCEKYLSKGRLVFIDGRLQTREWEDKSGNRRWTTEIVANRVQFLGGRDGAGSGPQAPPPPGDQDLGGGGRDSGGGSGAGKSGGAGSSGGGGGGGGFDSGFSDDDIPF